MVVHKKRHTKAYRGKEANRMAADERMRYGNSYSKAVKASTKLKLDAAAKARKKKHVIGG